MVNGTETPGTSASDAAPVLPVADVAALAHSCRRPRKATAVRYPGCPAARC